jgi:hypothetical protein
LSLLLFIQYMHAAEVICHVYAYAQHDAFMPTWFYIHTTSNFICYKIYDVR